jgi:hypothetical protein
MGIGGFGIIAALLLLVALYFGLKRRTGTAVLALILGGVFVFAELWSTDTIGSDEGTSPANVPTPGLQQAAPSSTP